MLKVMFSVSAPNFFRSDCTYPNEIQEIKVHAIENKLT
jgi:hypothetical protein